MATKDKTEPTLSDALKNAHAQATLALLPDPAAYMAEAISRGGKIIEATDTPNGFAATTWEFMSGTADEYNEIVYTSEHFPPMPNEHLDELAGAVEAALEAPVAASPVEGTAEPVALPELTHYSNPLREHLLAQSAYYDNEIARLARLTENAMKAQSAVRNALSSLDRDGL